MKYFLVGYMGSGKTRLGREMAEELSVRFIDLDTYISERQHLTITEIFSEQGEAGFRKLETGYLHEVCELYENFVLSTGGGTPCFNDNMEFMNSLGHTIFLNTDIDVIVERLIRGKYKRPIISKLNDVEIREFVRKHIQERLPFYNQAKEEVNPPNSN